MVTSFFNKSGHIKTVPLDDRKAVNAEWYSEVCIPGVLQALRERRPKCGTRGLLWHHDNAPVHTAVRTLDFLEAEVVQLLPHPPYSPDLAPCDFFLFPKVKSMLKGRRFSCDEEAVDAYFEAVSTIDKEEWGEVLKKWFERMQKCIDCDGIYFEKL